MNYEELYTELQTYTKEMNDTLKNKQKIFKSVCKNVENGDLKTAAKNVAVMETLSESYKEALEKMGNAIESFNSHEYIESGDFANQLLDYCEKSNVDVKGEFPNYEMFPYKVKVDVENFDMYIDRKKVQCLRPQSFVSYVKFEQDKLLKAAFNPELFANELALAYDLTLLKHNEGKSYAKDSDCYLTNIYKLLTPMRRFKKDYDQQSFAFDLARLYNANTECVSDGRKLQFGTSRNIKQAIRILDINGQEQFLSTIRFYR